MFVIGLIISIALISFFFGKQIKKRLFAKFIDYFTSSRNPQYTEFKKDHLQQLNNLVSHIPELRKEKSLKILEIGVGSGANFDFYPDQTRLVVVDPNPYFKSYYDKNRSKYPKILSEEIIVTTGENMDMVESNSVDAVVMTLVMCSVQNIPKLLQQIKRVLVPGGQFFYFEHVREWDSKKHYIRQFLHDMLSRSRIWPTLFDGCRLNRDMLKDIEATGFSSVDGKRIYAPVKHIIFQIIEPHLVGTATK